jgi:hypothetical protein
MSSARCLCCANPSPASRYQPFKRAIPASAGVVQIQARRRPGSLHPGWPGECEMRTRQYVYFPSEMVKSTELPGSPKTATLTVLVPWNKADEILIFLVCPSES